jgi:uncharacterized protein (TIGR01370 family)
VLFGVNQGPQRSTLDRILDQGFDGVLLAGTEGCEFWSGEGREISRTEGRREMARLVGAMRRYVRETRGIQDFLLFGLIDEAVLGEDLRADDLTADYVRQLDGLGAHQIYFERGRLRPLEELESIAQSMQSVRLLGGRRRPVLSMERIWDRAMPATRENMMRYMAYQRMAERNALIPYAAPLDGDLSRPVIVRPNERIKYPQPKRDAPT